MEEDLCKRKISPQTKQVVFNVYLYFKKIKADVKSDEHKKNINIIKLVADATGLSTSSITRIIKDGKEIQQESTTTEILFPEKEKEKHIRQKRISVDSETEQLIRNEVIQYYEIYKQVPSIRKLNAIIKYRKILNCSNEFLRNLLNELGFTNATATTETTKEPLETNEDVEARFKYLKYIKKLRDDDRNLFIFYDMTFSNGGDFVPANVQSIVVLHFSGANSFTDGSTIKTKHTGNALQTARENHIENYNWLQKIVTPLLPDKSVIIFNTPYIPDRKACLKTQPVSADTRGHIQKWLTKYKIPFHTTNKKRTLLNLIKAEQNEHEFSIEKLMETKGHKVLHFPPVHKKFNPVSLALKDGMKISDVTVNLWKKYIEQVKNNESESYQEDLNALAPFTDITDQEYPLVTVKTEIEVDIDLNTGLDEEGHAD